MTTSHDAQTKQMKKDLEFKKAILEDLEHLLTCYKTHTEEYKAIKVMIGVRKDEIMFLRMSTE